MGASHLGFFACWSKDYLKDLVVVLWWCLVLWPCFQVLSSEAFRLKLTPSLQDDLPKQPSVLGKTC